MTREGRLVLVSTVAVRCSVVSFWDDSEEGEGDGKSNMKQGRGRRWGGKGKQSIVMSCSLTFYQQGEGSVEFSVAMKLKYVEEQHRDRFREEVLP